MNDKFRNKYRIASHRMPRWDYSGDGIYFITLVTQNRECNLGEIIDGHISLSEMGKIVDNEWLKSFDIRDELYLDEYIIMPNHLHAIIILNNNGVIKNEMDDMGNSDGTHDSDGSHGSDDTHVETHGRASL
ncbi:MAG: transposase, partial [Bacteroidales bacterium]|nr:transposase [Bacteroidales bacterium]